MNLTDINSISKYNRFLQHLNPFGWYQKKLLGITIFFWMFAGIVRTIFNKEVFCNSNEDLPLLTSSIMAGIFCSAYFSYYYNRRKIMFGLSGIYTLGGFMLLFSFELEWIQKMGLYFVCFAQYSVCILASCILFESIEVSLIPITAWMLVFTCHGSKFISVIVFSQFSDSENAEIIFSSIILSFGLLIIGGSFLFRESLRYLIDNDIQEAEIVALKISEENNCADERILNIIEGSFVWNKVNIKKYGLLFFWKYKSLARETYYLGLSFFCLGVFGKLAIVIFKINENKKSAQFEHDIQLLWISIFQMIGFLPGSNFGSKIVLVDKIMERRKICMIAASVGLVFSSIMAILVKYIVIPHILVGIFSVLGLNSFIGSVLFFFMFLKAVEFYPHTIRTLGLSICLCCYYMGQLVFNLHLCLIEDLSSSLELVLTCSLLMIFHLFNTSQTLGKGVNYEIKEIEEREYNED